jgi:HYDIN/CFA65/VesB-like, Ig-like domain/Abnormal spindle-like microcephaly-assoc'd, ASPM-SPD-2-Hydin
MRCLGSPRRPACWPVTLLALSLICTPAMGQSSLAASPVNFGSVQVGSSLIRPLVLTNNGRASVTIYKVTVSGTGFLFVGPQLPVSVPAGQSAAFSVSFTPQTAATFQGSATAWDYLSWGGRKSSRYSKVSVALSGTGQGTTASPGYLNAPSSMNLGSVPVGTRQTQSMTLSNSGGTSVVISGATVNGTCYSVSGLTFPYNLGTGGSVNLSVTFTPASSGTSSATLMLSSDASDQSVAVALTGTGTTSVGNLAVNPSSLNFGSVNIGSTQTQNGSVSASGGSVTLSSASSSNSAFTVSGVTLPTTIPAGQSLPFTVTFAPTASGTASANISFFTTSSTSASQTASGSGATQPHVVNLSWNASTSTSISGYNVYRGTSASGPYAKVNSALDPAMNYSDSSVQSGTTYFYVTTAVDSSGTESSYSNQVQAVVPFP